MCLQANFSLNVPPGEHLNLSAPLGGFAFIGPFLNQELITQELTICCLTQQLEASYKMGTRVTTNSK